LTDFRKPEMEGKIIFLAICFVYAIGPFISYISGTDNPNDYFYMINSRTWWIGAILFLFGFVFFIRDILRRR